MSASHRGGPTAPEAFEVRLEHIELQQRSSQDPRPDAVLPSPSSHSRQSLLSSDVDHDTSAATQSHRQPAPPQRTPLFAVSPGVRDYTGQSGGQGSSHSRSRSRSPQRPRPAPTLGTGLYTIESHIPVAAPPQLSSEQHSARARNDTASRGHQGGGAGHKASTPALLTRPEKKLDHLHGSVKRAMATAEETNATLAQYQEWVDRQKRSQRRWRSAIDPARIRDGAEKLYKRFVLEGILRQKHIPPSQDGRHVPLEPGIARRKPLKDDRTGRPYLSNFIRSSRYTLWNFLPKQLFFQFSKLANFYFLIIGILQMIPGLSTTGSFTTIAPLIAFVALSMAKEGYDDYRRYKLDKLENKSVAWVLDPENLRAKTDRRSRPELLRIGKLGRSHGAHVRIAEVEAGMGNEVEQAKKWSQVEWQDVRVGDIIQLRRDDSLPADIILLHATGPNGVAYIETMALDGETNLKSKRACPLLAKHCNSIAEMTSLDAEVVVEDPNLDLYNFEGRATVKGETMPLTMNEVVYRGSILRNTTKAIGLVINTGEECKIRMNARKNVHAKAPEMQYAVNRIVVILVGFVIALSLGCTAGYIVWRRDHEGRAWYLRHTSVPLKNIFIAFIIAFNTLIPLSLYVSLEIVKLGQAYLLNDIEMYDPVSDTPMVANTTTILENLGQVSYVFSDKTGTLTENLMKLRKVSVAGTAWLHDSDLQKIAAEKEAKNKLPAYQEAGVETAKGRQTPSPKATAPGSGVDFANEHLIDEGRLPNIHPARANSASHWKSTARPGQAQPELNTEDILRFLRAQPNSPFSRKARQFILCIALCHTCLPETRDDGSVTFQAASPDELALVEAARDMGYLLVDRAAQSIKLESHDIDGSTIMESYEILDVIEFSSERKRMSVVCRMPDGKLCLFSKGADNVILPRLKQSQLATQAMSSVERRASVRKSIELEKALKRQSLHSVKRDSMNLVRAASTLDRRDSRGRRKSNIITDEVDYWLSRRENDGIEPEFESDDHFMGRGRSMEASRATEPYDSLVDESLALNEAAVYERCFQHVHDFASEGLRTLIFGYRYLEEDDYQKWKTVYHQATTSLVKRQERIEEAAELIEQSLDLAGATAIEDKLQEGVPETIDKFRRANIKVWMLTGDKRETAINIAHSTRICKPFSQVYILDAAQPDWQEKMADALVEVGRGMVPHSVIVIDGHTLGVVEGDEVLHALFLDLAVRVDSVICCRASPSQKANLVKCIRYQVPSSVTLAVGDGANDIAMIQASHVGIGISGREGLQAARISDYSIAQFRFLQRLLFVHGRWNYIRTGKYIVGTFWKEVLFYMLQAQYQKFNGYTGTSLFESTSLTVFNTLFTSLPVILLGIFEKDLNAETLIAVPELYSFGQKNRGFNMLQYLGWMFMAASSSAIIFFSVYCLYGTSHYPADTGLYAVGTLAFSLAVIFINLKMLVLELHNRTVISFLGLFISILGWFLWNVLLSLVFPPSPGPYVVRGSFIKGFGKNGMWWLVHFVALSALIVFELAVSTVRKSLWPTDQDLMQEVEHIDGVMDVIKEHAGEHGGEAGPVYQSDENAADPPSKKLSVSTAVSAPIGTALSLSPRETGGWHFGGTKRGSRHMTDEYYVPPEFTPPAEEHENPMDIAGGSGKKQKSTPTPGTGRWIHDESPTIVTTNPPAAAGAGSAQNEGFYFTQSPVELKTPTSGGRPWPLSN